MPHNAEYIFIALNKSLQIFNFLVYKMESWILGHEDQEGEGDYEKSNKIPEEVSLSLFSNNIELQVCAE